MLTQSSMALAGFITWALLLLAWMEILRSGLVLGGKVPANGFVPDNANLSAFMQRLARAHANCIEGLPIFGGLLILAIATGRSALTDPLAYWLLAARIAQSSIHLVSISPTAVTARFSAFTVQMVIGLYWAARLLFAGL
ncbi:MAG: MAPEG family protein [Rhodanobacter sp.]|nr:MAG: MAPEG family protein [Rhodanobacter sp.]TAM13142.1 MAG: MAPEG family protein [Rhodanobacter sp.]TAM35143.1 MAG: MAPEG family protein [Rhodanobacter sp.]